MKTPSATYPELAILASSVGIVDSTDAGRSSFVAWLTKDQKAARKALFTRVAARRAAASAAKQLPPGTRPINAAEAQALRTGESTRYPSDWARGRTLGTADVVSSAGLPKRLGSAAARQSERAARPAVKIIDVND